MSACEWFAWCGRPAAVLVPHPVLGGVPTCGRCANRPAVAELLERDRAVVAGRLEALGIGGRR